MVILIGTHTYFGRTIELVQLARPKLHVKAVITRVVRWLLIIVIALIGAVTVLSLIRHVPMIEMIPLMLVLLMSAIPVALPVMFTVSMAVGTKELAILAAATAQQIFADSAPVMPLSFTPFDAKNRHTEAMVEQNGQRLRVMKGAVRTLAESCGLQSAEIESLETRTGQLAQKGYRTLAVARGTETGMPVLLGLVTLYDPPRPDARQLIATLHDLGVSVKMLTGDALAVAREIAQGVGLLNIQRVTDIKATEDTQADTNTANFSVDVDGYAEVYPEDKYRVVQHLQTAGHVTGMTGDGVNDAPALRQAEVGIAISSATDVAKGAASVVLTEPGLINIVALVEQGRMTYQRILTWVINKISRTIMKVAVVAIAFLVTGKFIISAFAMLLLAFLTDFAKIALATDRVETTGNLEYRRSYHRIGGTWVS